MLHIHNKHRENIDSYNIWHERIVSARMRLKKDFLTIIGVYAPEEGREEQSEEFYKQLQRAVQAVNPEDKLIIAGDLNA